MAIRIATCCLCNRPRKIAWHLDRYFGVGSRSNGETRKACYEPVSHDSHGRPRHPARYAAAAKKWNERATNREQSA